MHKVVLHTNVIISALLSKGIPYKILNELVSYNKITLHLSKNILAEYESVIEYEKFKIKFGFSKAAKQTIEDLKYLGQ